MALKQDGATSDVPVVILIGNGAPYDANRGTQVGADANLPKPWDTQTMLEKVTELVGKGATAKLARAPPLRHLPPLPPRPRKLLLAAAPKPAQQQEPPRSATIMGMPTIKMPAGVAPPVTAQPTKTTAMAVPPIAPDVAHTAPGAAAPGLRPPAKSTPSAAAAAPAATSTPASSNGGIGGMNRAPKVSGTPTKRSALVDRTLAKMAARLAEAAGIEPGSPELLALLKLSTEGAASFGKSCRSSRSKSSARTRHADEAPITRRANFVDV